MTPAIEASGGGGRKVVERLKIGRSRREEEEDVTGEHKLDDVWGHATR
jgi:hypothetical protein